MFLHDYCNNYIVSGKEKVIKINVVFPMSCLSGVHESVWNGVQSYRRNGNVTVVFDDVVCCLDSCLRSNG